MTIKQQNHPQPDYITLNKDDAMPPINKKNTVMQTNGFSTIEFLGFFAIAAGIITGVVSFYNASNTEAKATEIVRVSYYLIDQMRKYCSGKTNPYKDCLQTGGNVMPTLLNTAPPGWNILPGNKDFIEKGGARVSIRYNPSTAQYSDNAWLLEIYVPTNDLQKTLSATQFYGTALSATTQHQFMRWFIK